jgi:hypothetical protein
MINEDKDIQIELIRSATMIISCSTNETSPELYLDAVELLRTYYGPLTRKLEKEENE